MVELIYKQKQPSLNLKKQQITSFCHFPHKKRSELIKHKVG